MTSGKVEYLDESGLKKRVAHPDRIFVICLLRQILLLPVLQRFTEIPSKNFFHILVPFLKRKQEKAFIDFGKFITHKQRC